MLTANEQDKDTTVVKFYGLVGDWYRSAEAFTSFFDPIGAKYKNVLIRTHSYGGSVIDGNVIYNSILNSNAYVTLKIEGVAASMMSIVMLAADKIVMADNALVMIHCPSGSTQGTAKDHASTAKLLLAMEKNFGKRYSEKTGKPAKDVLAWFDGSDHWFDADEALALGLVDEIVPATVANIKQLDKPEPSTEVVAIYNRYQALLTDENFHQNTDDSMKKMLITMLGLTGVTEASSDEDFAKAVAAARLQSNTPPPAPVTPTPEATVLAETFLKAIESVNNKPFDAAARATLLDIGAKAGIPAMSSAIGLMSPVAVAAPAETPQPAIPQIVSMIGGAAATGAAAGRDSWTWDDYQEKDPAALAKMEDGNPKAFNALYKAKYGVEL